jgi:long-chain acyl-CoA synthetase
VPNVPAIQKWSQEHHVSLPSSPEAIVKDDRVRALLKKEIEAHGSAFKGFESIQDFALVDQDFTTDNGMLTPSLKLKRRKVMEVFGPVLDALYAKRASKPGSGARVSA